MKLFILILLLAMLQVSGSAYAQKPKEKGVLIRWWERVTGRSVSQARPVPRREVKPETPEIKVPVVEKKKIEPVVEKEPPPAEKAEEEKVKAEPEEKLLSSEEVPVERKPARRAEEAVLEEEVVAGEGTAEVFKPEPEIKKPEPPVEATPGKEAIPEKEAEMEPEKPVEKEKPSREIPVTKEKMLEVMKRRLDIYSQIVYIVPGIMFEETEDGGKEYFHQTREGDTVKLSDLDKETLYGLYVRVNNEATRINTERLIRQIQQQEQLRRAIPRIPQPPPQPPQPPRVYTPPRPPQPPPQPPVLPDTHRR